MEAKKEKIKNHIIEVTTELLNAYNGDTKKITSRLIAERAGIGLGSINYFFGSKENLITECIQRKINQLLAGFVPDVTDFAKEDGLSDQTRLLSWAGQTYDFLFENPSIAEISILSDMQDYSPDCNSVYTQKGFTFAMRSGQSEGTKKLLAFLLVSAMQAAFLARDAAKDFLGYDLRSKDQRNRFLFDTVTMLWHGTTHKEGTVDET